MTVPLDFPFMAMTFRMLTWRISAMSPSSGMYTFRNGSLSTVSLKNRETARKGCRMYENILKVCVFNTAPWSPESNSDEPLRCDNAELSEIFRNTRQRGELNIPRCRRTTGQRSFTYRGASSGIIWETMLHLQNLSKVLGKELLTYFFLIIVYEFVNTVEFRK